MANQIGVFQGAIEKGERISKSCTGKQERGIWQRRFLEHAIRDETDFARDLDYIHFNPVKRGYVTRGVDLPRGHKGLIRRFIGLCG